MIILIFLLEHKREISCQDILKRREILRFYCLPRKVNSIISSQKLGFMANCLQIMGKGYKKNDLLTLIWGQRDVQDGMPKTGQPTVFRVQWNSMAGHPGYESDSLPMNKVLFQIKGLCSNHLLNMCSTW